MWLYIILGLYYSVRCQTIGDLRLVSGGMTRQGRVEIFYTEWGTICDDGFDDVDASVACRQLGYRCFSHENVVPHGPDSSKILLDDLACEGNESKLFQCHNNGWLVNNCVHGEDVGIACLVYGNWGIWSNWSACNESFGFQNRSRSCVILGSFFDGNSCEGLSFEIQLCETFSRQEQNDDSGGQHSTGVLAAVALGCIISTTVVMLIIQFAIRKFRNRNKDTGNGTIIQQSYETLQRDQISDGENPAFLERPDHVPNATYDNVDNETYENVYPDSDNNQNELKTEETVYEITEITMSKV